MNNMAWLIRALQWVRNPPSARHVMIAIALVAAGIGIVTLEYFDLWPAWAQLQQGRGVPMPRP